MMLSLDTMAAEPGPRVLSMGLHPHLMGVPHRLHELRRMLDLLQDRGDVAFVTPARTADWFRAVVASGAACRPDAFAAAS